MTDRPPSTLDRETIAALYDAHGVKQDSAGWYEDPPLTRLIEHLPLADSGRVLELGAGTGRFAERLLTDHLPPEARYVAADLSGEMCRLSAARLAAFGERVEVHRASATDFDPPAGELDVVVSAYMLDILAEHEIAAVFERCHRGLRPGGHLGLVGLTPGESLVGRVVSSIWSAVHRAKPTLVGGCRPMRLTPLLDAGRWQVEHRSVVRAWGIPSEVLVARRR